MHTVLTASQLNLRLAQVQVGDMNQGSPSLCRLSIFSGYDPNVKIVVFVMLLLLLLSHYSRVRLCATPRRQRTRLPGPLDSPGKNTGVGCQFLLQCMKVKSESEVAQSVRLLATPCTAAYQAPPSMGFSRQEYWSGVPLLSPQDNYFFRSPEEEIIISSWIGG